MMLSVVATPLADTVTALAQAPEPIADVPSDAVPLAIRVVPPLLQAPHVAALDAVVRHWPLEPGVIWPVVA